MTHFRIFLHYGLIADVVANEYRPDGLQFRFLKECEQGRLVVAEFVRTDVMGIMVVENNED